MTAQAIMNGAIHVNNEGFMTNSSEWTKAVALEIARDEGLDTLTDKHWQVIDFCRATATESGRSPTLRQITAGTGISTKEMFALFPKGPAKKVARIAGLGKPEGCV
jgi:tRNA 2-thiouridine synthesizing protein E